MLIGAITYSNLQRRYATPAYVLGILLDEKDLVNLESLKIKEIFQPEGTHVDPYDLSKIDEEIQKFSSIIKKQKLIALASEDPFKPEQLDRQKLDTVYDSIIANLVDQDLVVMDRGIKEIRIHDYFDDKTYEYNNSTLSSFFSSQTYQIIVEKKPNFSKIMEFARLIVWEKFLINRRYDLTLTRTVLNEKKENPSHLLQLNWPLVSLDVYANSFVGFPWLTIKQSHQIKQSSLMLGQLVSFFPFAKSCVGQMNSQIEPFYCSNVKRSEHGMLLSVKSNENRCSKCRTAFDRLKFSNDALNNLESNDDDDPLVEYRNSLFCIYVTKFNDKLKIGRALLNRGISRLVEQGASDALVFFPIPSFEETDKLENNIKNYLKTKKELLSYGINNVTDKIQYQDKIKMFNQWKNIPNRSNFKLYDEIIKLLKEDSTFTNMIEFANNRVLDFTPNWQIMDDIEFDKLHQLDVFWNWVHGEIKGVIGAFLIINNNIIDLRKYYGSLYRGVGFS